LLEPGSNICNHILNLFAEVSKAQCNLVTALAVLPWDLETLGEGSGGLTQVSKVSLYILLFPSTSEETSAVGK